VPVTCLATAENTCRMLFEAAERAEGEPAVIDGAATISYGRLAERALGFAAALQSAGVGRDDRVAVLLRRNSDAAAAFFGVLSAGAIAVMVNDQLRPRQIEHVLNDSGAVVLLSSAAIMDRFARPLVAESAIVDISEVAACASCTPVQRVGNDVAQIVYTSGSTGLPKGVTVSHSNLWAGTRAVTSYVGISHRDRIASLLPFTFDYGLNQLLCAARNCAPLVIERSPIAARIVRTLREQEVSVVAAVPPLWLQLLNAPDFRASPLRSLRAMTNSGGRLPREAVRALRASQPKADLFLMYGLTEAFRSTYLPPHRVDRKPTSIGQAIPGAEVLIVDDKARPCATGEIGELVHRGPTVALGYWNDPEATDRVYRSHPLRPPGAPAVERTVFSGDLVYRDEDGDIFFVGREDAMIKTLGYRVSPDEVSDALYASGEVVEAVVTAEPDDLRGQRIVAYIVLTEGGRLARLEEFVSREMPRYMQPSRIEVRNELHRTTSGKHDAVATARERRDPV
jgi:amino acid adenylation domain-containing protein